MGYISLHGCFGNTPSDTEDLAEHQLKTGRDHWKGTYRSTQNLVGGRKEGKKRRVARSGPTLREVGDLMSDPDIDTIDWDRGEAFETVGEYSN